MMIAPNSLAHQRDGVQRDGEEEAGYQRKVAKQELRGQVWSVDVPTGLSRSGVVAARNRRKHEGWYGVLLHRKGRGEARD